MKAFLIGIWGIFCLISLAAVKGEGETTTEIERKGKHEHRKHHRHHHKRKRSHKKDGKDKEEEKEDEGEKGDDEVEEVQEEEIEEQEEQKEDYTDNESAEETKPKKHRKHRHSHKEHKKHHKHHHNNYEPSYNENTYGYNVHKTCKHSGMVALTFDDGVVPETSDILDILSRNGVPGTFFVLGNTIEQYPTYRKVLHRIINEGHTLASHTHSHPDLTSLGAEGIKYELNHSGDVFEEATGGKRPKFMRPPYGSINDEVVSVCNRLGYEIIHWNLDTNDWRYPYDPSPIIDSLYQHDDGALSSKIVLMHDKPITVQALDSIIKFYQNKGYTFVNMEKCLGMKGYF